MSEAWKNGSVAQGASYGNIEQKQKDQSQKITGKYYDSALKQTTEYIEALPPGTYRFMYPIVLEDIVNGNENLRIVGYQNDTAIVEKR